MCLHGMEDFFMLSLNLIERYRKIDLTATSDVVVTACRYSNGRRIMADKTKPPKDEKVKKVLPPGRKMGKEEARAYVF